MFDDTLPSRASAIDRGRALLAGWLRDRLAAHRRRREVVRLAGLSDHMLRDIGLTRDEAVLYRRTGRHLR